MIDQGVIQQVGRPMDLYDHPANRFVAEFVGTNSDGGRDRNRAGTLVNREFLRRLPRQVDSSKLETSWLKILNLNFAGGTSPSDS